MQLAGETQAEKSREFVGDPQGSSKALVAQASPGTMYPSDVDMNRHATERTVS